MKEIAEKTGVSVSSVSLVLNGRDSGRVKPEIARRVRETAERLGYKPNPLARSLRTSHTRILGFVSEEIATTPFAGGIILGAQNAANAFGYMLITVNTDGEADEAKQIAALKRYGVDGFLYAKMSNRVTDIPRELSDYPTVLVDATDRAGRAPGITPDEQAIGYDATMRLVRAGCRRIAYVGCAKPLVAQTERFAGYRHALADAGLRFDESLAVDVMYHQPAQDAVDRLIGEQRPDGVFCWNDARALYVYQAALKLDLTVGRDLSVVGVDNHRLIAETVVPELTTVELPHYEMGYWAVCKAVTLIEGRKPAANRMARTSAPLPPLDGPDQVKVHCALIEKDSVADGKR
ncbi:LacI family transcriptional regulator [Bifidobacterium sp. DSM 109958]|uniref:LacI family transcriptional regulator n=2 Tax=Bifidobacterium moraviense TaxID=2675323 RepID=A0A7Y0F2Z7_9BIFI|nr:LacI family transcriptional regulator [Bifidobacterium sp. DSM 109958]